MSLKASSSRSFRLRDPGWKCDISNHLQLLSVSLREVKDYIDWSTLRVYAFLSSPLSRTRADNRPLLEVTRMSSDCSTFAIVCDNPVGLKLPQLETLGVSNT